MSINQIRNSDKYEVTRVIKDELTKDKIPPIVEQIQKAIDETKAKLEDEPKSSEARIKELTANLKLLEERKSKFDALGIKVEEKAP